MKPRYVGERWPLLDEGDTWEDYRPEFRPENFMPVETFLYALAGHLRFLGRVRKTTAGIVSQLLGREWDGAARIVHGEYLERIVGVPTPPGGEWTFPGELMMLERERAAENLELLAQAFRTYRDGTPQSLAGLVSPPRAEVDDGTDREVFGDLAQLTTVYETLLAEDVEILFARIW